MSDRFSSNAPSLTGPASAAFAITPDDATDLSEVTRALYIGVGGNVAMRFLSGQVLTFSNLAAGSVLPVRIDRVLAAGTTATGLIGLV